MDDRFDLYTDFYGNIHVVIYREIRGETYGVDLGQASWITRDECLRFLSWLQLTESSRVLEVACGSGGIACFTAAETGAGVVGIDINPEAIQAARERSASMEIGNNPSFQMADAAGRLPFADDVFDAVFCNDSINHLPDRLNVLREWHRILRPGGKILYTDPIVVTGQISNEEIALRSSIGFFVFTPPGVNERLLENAGFTVLCTEDVTGNVVETSRRWYEARARRQELLLPMEGQSGFEGLQRFLRMVNELSSQGRLSRHAYLARK